MSSKPPSKAPRPSARASAGRNPEGTTPEGDRIAKVMARAGLCSRREAEALILDGKVSVNGKTITSPALNVTARDRIVVEGKPLPQFEPTQLWRYHKPAGLVTTAKDPEGRPTVFEHLPPDLPRVVSVGRLDINTEGLLLLTNDGELARLLELPATGWTRRYRVRAWGEVSQEELDKLKDGIEVEGVRYASIEARIDKVQGHNIWLTMSLKEGKNREVKRVLGALGLTVNRLIRLSFGPFQIGDLAEGTVARVPTRVLLDQLGSQGEAFAARMQMPAPQRAPEKKFEERKSGGKKSPAKDAASGRSASGKSAPGKSTSGKSTSGKSASGKAGPEKKVTPYRLLKERQRGPKDAHAHKGGRRK